MFGEGGLGVIKKENGEDDFVDGLITLVKL